MPVDKYNEYRLVGSAGKSIGEESVQPGEPLDWSMTMEDTVQRLQAEMDRRRAADVAAATSIKAAEEIMQQQALTHPKLAAKQARLLYLLKSSTPSVAFDKPDAAA
jgi:hypothetical protein